jgi:hypothetical protein
VLLSSQLNHSEGIHPRERRKRQNGKRREEEREEERE